MLKEGSKAPAFALENDKGKKVKLSDFKGKNVVLYFYPKDDTPGCTKEACAFTEFKPKFSRKNTIVLGVSKDSVDKHGKFKDKYDLKIELLSDPDGAVCEKYGVWQEKKNYGKTYMGIVRSTFVIDTAGKVAKAYPKVRVEGHAEAVLEAVGEL